MNGFEIGEYIAKAPEEVFELISNPAEGSRVVDNIKECKKLSSGPIGVGTRFRETRLMDGKEASTDLVVTAYEPYSRVGFGTEVEGIKVSYQYYLVPAEAGTQVRWVCELEASGLRKMMLPMIAGIMKKQDGNHLKKLKEFLEAKPG